MTLREWFWIIFLGAVWGGSFIFNALLIRELGPLWVTAIRVGIGALGCWVFLFARRKKVPGQLKLWLALGMLGVLNYAIPFALFPMAQKSLASGVAAIVNALTPIMTVIVSHFWRGGERISWMLAIGDAGQGDDGWRLRHPTRRDRHETVRPHQMRRARDRIGKRQDGTGDSARGNGYSSNSPSSSPSQ